MMTTLINNRVKKFIGIAFCVFAFLLASTHSTAREFRNIKQIRTPIKQNFAVPDNAVIAVSAKPLPRKVVEQEVGKLISAWNTPQMAETLAEEFYDRTRLLDRIDTALPKDAKLRIESLLGSQTLLEYSLPDQQGETAQVVSHVSAVVRTRLEFNSAEGFVSLPGTNEYLMKVVRGKKAEVE
jgi:hypothetical protein